MGINPLILIVFIIVFLISFPTQGEKQKTNNSFPALVKVQKTSNDSFSSPTKFQPTDNEWRFKNSPGAKGPPLSWACKEEHENCIYKYIYEQNKGPPHYTDPCCENLKSAVPCVCKYLRHPDINLSKAAFYLVDGCGWSVPTCPIMPMPKVCRPEVRNCVDRCIYGGITPRQGDHCCQRFKHAKHCVCSFVRDGDKFWLAENAKDAIRGCRFTNPQCAPKKV